METNSLLQAVYDRAELKRMILPHGKRYFLPLDMDDVKACEPRRDPLSEYFEIVSGAPPYVSPLERLKKWATANKVDVFEDQLTCKFGLTFACPENYFFVPTFEGSVVAAIRNARDEARITGAVKWNTNRLYLSPGARRALRESEDYRYYTAAVAAINEPSFEGMTLEHLNAPGSSFAVAYVTPESVTPQREMSRFSA